MAVLETELLVRARRGRQLTLTVMAVLLTVGGYALVTMGTTGKTPVGVGGFVALVAASYLAAHVLVTRLAPGADPALLPTAAVLSGLGYAVIYRLDAGRAGEQFGWLLLGLALFSLTLVLIRDHRSLDAYTYTIGLAGMFFLLLPIAPVIGRTINGARLWVDFGFFTFQPAEIGKVLIVIFLASYLNAKKELLAVTTRRFGPFRFPEPRHLGPLLLAWAVSLAVLFAEKDLGSSMLFFGIFVVMVWTATGRATFLALGVILFAAGAYLGYATFSHVQDRVDVWLHALEPQFANDAGFQVAQSEFAMATGGIAGTGLGKGSPGDIPYAATDFIFAAIGEELGLFGTTAVLLLFVVLIARGFRAAIAREDGFSKLLAVGLTTAVALQAFIIVGGVTRVIPLTGITLPFVSYGGSSLVTNFVLLALLVRTSAPPEAAPALGRSRGSEAPTSKKERLPPSGGEPTIVTRGKPSDG